MKCQQVIQTGMYEQLAQSIRDYRLPDKNTPTREHENNQEVLSLKNDVDQMFDQLKSQVNDSIFKL